MLGVLAAPDGPTESTAEHTVAMLLALAKRLKQGNANLAQGSWGPRTGVLVGMGADPEVARWGARWRLASWSGLTDGPLAAARDAMVPALISAGVVGTMPNIPANRIQTVLDLGGPGFTVSSEELSGVDAPIFAALAALVSGTLGPEAALASLMARIVHKE